MLLPVGPDEFHGVPFLCVGRDVRGVDTAFETSVILESDGCGAPADGPIPTAAADVEVGLKAWRESTTWTFFTEPAYRHTDESRRSIT